MFRGSSILGHQAEFRPRIVVWLFADGGDLERLSEAATSHSPSGFDAFVRSSFARATDQFWYTLYTETWLQGLGEEHKSNKLEI